MIPSYRSFWLLILVSLHGIQSESFLFQSASQPQSSSESTAASANPTTFKIAVIGSGPSGASAAYFLSKANDKLLSTSTSDSHYYSDSPVSFEVTVFEKEERIGGRTEVVYPYHDQRYHPVELGASIFADVNRNLNRAVKDFGLETGARIGEPESVVGIWDGQQFLIEGIDEGWWNSARFLWRYGYSPLTAKGIVKKLVSQFSRLYDPRFLHRRSSSQSQSSLIKSKLSSRSKSDSCVSVSSHDNNTNRNDPDSDIHSIFNDSRPDMFKSRREGLPFPSSDQPYTKSGYPWHSIEDLAKALDFSEQAAQDAQSMFYDRGVSKLFIEEMIEAATRVNYAQNVDAIHAIGGGVSLAASGATGVKDGNYRIFQEMITRSGAKLRMGPHGEVTGLIKFLNLEEALHAGKITQEEFSWRQEQQRQQHQQQHNFSRSSPELKSVYLENQDREASLSPDSGAKWWLGTESGYGDLFDAVFVGTPWKNAGISLINTDKTIPTPEYVHLHVTLLVTNASHPSPAYFGRGKSDDVPTTILTSYSAVRRASRDKSEKSLNRFWDRFVSRRSRTEDHETETHEPKLEFNSLNYLAQLPQLSDDLSSSVPSDERTSSSSSSSPSEKESPLTEHLVKIFSLTPMSDEKLVEIMGDSIRWVHRKEWDAYPVLRPTREFPPVEADQNLFFVNALESLVSTMETSTVASRNAVAIFLEKHLGPDFIHGGEDCPDWDSDDTDDDDDNDEQQTDWASWGCRSG